jgi:hypothetical protein
VTIQSGDDMGNSNLVSKKKLMTEAQVKAKVKAMLKKYNVFYFMPSASIYGKSGIPDFVCCIDGLFLVIETKSEEAGIGGLTSLQKKVKSDIEGRDGIYRVVYNEESLQSLAQLLERILNEEAV